MYRIGFVGTGNMASAILGGILGSGLVPASEIAVCDPLTEKMQPFGEKGCAMFAAAAELCRSCKYVVLAVKPQVIEGVLQQIAPVLTGEHVLISIAAGITAEYIRRVVGFACKVVLVMPNTPLLLGCGASFMARVEPISEEEFTFAQDVFRTAGIVEVIPAQQLNESIPIHSSSPAFVYLFAKTICDYAEGLGFEHAQASRMMCQTLIGAAHMMNETGKSEQELIDMVCSPKGVTLEGMDALREKGFAEALEAAYERCVKRAKELGR